MNRITRPPVVDEHGVEHAPGCHVPGWTSQPSTIRGWHLARCARCSAVRLIRARQPKEEAR
jgi:hypothetical protein